MSRGRVFAFSALALLGIACMGLLHVGDCRAPPGSYEDAGPLAYPAAGLAMSSPFGPAPPRTPIAGPLRVHPDNGRYFADANGRIVLLTGSHTWQSLQDRGMSEPLEPFDFGAYLDFLVARNHNFIRLWVAEESNWISGLKGDYWSSPMMYQRTGPGLANDGKAKFDVDEFDSEFFDRLRERVARAGERGIYVSVMLFNGWSVDPKGLGLVHSWQGHPFHRDNNVNQIDGDPDGDESGREVHTLAIPEITRRQEAYLRKIIDTVGSLPNVLYEISNESTIGSTNWQEHMAGLIRATEANRLLHHPIGMTNEFPASDEARLFAGPAEWVSPGGALWQPPTHCGPFVRPRAQRILDAILGRRAAVESYQYNPPAAVGRKVVVTDTDHLWGIGGDRRWVWRSFTRGLNPIFMDIYDNAASVWMDPRTPPPDAPQWRSLRNSLGDVRALADRVPMASMLPRGDLASTHFALADPKSGHYVAYLPAGGPVTMNLAQWPGELDVNWFDPGRRAIIPSGSQRGGSATTFFPPFEGDAVLWLRPSGGAGAKEVARDDARR